MPSIPPSRPPGNRLPVPGAAVGRPDVRRQAGNGYPRAFPPLCRPAGALPVSGWASRQCLREWVPARPAGGAAVATSDDPLRRRRNLRRTITVKPSHTKATPKTRTRDGIASMIKLRPGSADTPYPFPARWVRGQRVCTFPGGKGGITAIGPASLQTPPGKLQGRHPPLPGPLPRRQTLRDRRLLCSRLRGGRPQLRGS